jgi:hypothetical protein
MPPDGSPPSAIPLVPPPVPTPIDRLYDYVQWQTDNPVSPLPADWVAGDFDQSNDAINLLQQRLALIQRDDGTLADKVVTATSLADDVVALLDQAVIDAANSAQSAADDAAASAANAAASAANAAQSATDAENAATAADAAFAYEQGAQTAQAAAETAAANAANSASQMPPPPLQPGKTIIVNVAATGYDFATSLLLAGDGKWDAAGHAIKNGALAVLGTDIPTLAQVQGLISGAGSVPPPVAGDVDKVLTATGVSAFGWLAFTVARISDATAYMKGLLTTVADAAGFRAAINVPPATRQIATSGGLQGGGDLSADRNLSLTDTGVVAGSYDFATVQVDAKGRVTAAFAGTPLEVPDPALTDVGKFLKATATSVYAWAAMVVADLSDATAYMKGLLTTINDAASLRTNIGAVPTSRVITVTAPITGGGDLSANRNIGHGNSGVAAGAYQAANITVDAMGHVTAAANGSIAPKFATTAVNLVLDNTYHLATVECTAAVQITLPNLPDDANNRGFRVRIENNSATEADNVTVIPAGGSGNTLDGLTSRKLWPGTAVMLQWRGGNKWVSVRDGGWIPADRAIATLGTEATLDVSMMAIPANAREAKIIWREIQPVGGTGDLLGRISIDGMATFDAGSTNYAQVAGIINTAGGASGIISAGNAQWTFGLNAATNVASTGAPKCDGELTFGKPRDGATRPAGWGHFCYPTSATAWETDYYSTHEHKTAHSIDGFRLFFASRTIAIGSCLEVYWR